VGGKGCMVVVECRVKSGCAHIYTHTNRVGGRQMQTKKINQ